MFNFLYFLGLAAFLTFSLVEGNPSLQLEAVRGYLHKPQSEEGQGQSPSAIESFELLSPKYKLNDSWIPSHYELELVVILDNDPAIGEQYTAPGKVTIDAYPTAATNVLTLHVNLYTIQQNSVKITSPDTPTEYIGVVGPITYSNDDRHLVIITLNVTLSANRNYQIYMEFVAPISTDRYNGLYLSTYTDPDNGQQQRVAATQMESYHARQLFPCFDEPNLKATFGVTLIYKDNYTALANMDRLTSVPDPIRPGWTRDGFRTTVKMPTYLYAMVVSNFDYSEANLDLFKQKPVRVYAPPHIIRAGGGNYSADMAAKLLAFLDLYFDFDYPLSKMDSVSVPQFSAGAMENYGLNLYREEYLIHYPGISLETSKNLVASVLSHELAHQNFGNLVTCEWWDQLWLNEAFATYVSYLGVDAVTPEFRHREWILNDAFQYSMTVDASSRSHPLQNDALTPDQIDMYFTGITYEKGGSINRMTENFLTEETYQKGLRLYLKDMAYKGAHADDLSRNLDIAARQDNRLPVTITMKQILDSWTLQISHPLVRVNVAGPNSVHISQERYTDTASPSLWYVPITVATQDKPTLINHVPQLWLENYTPIKSYEHDTSKWIMVNQDATGYYRVLYDKALTPLIRNQLVQNASVISPLSRSQLLDDYFTLAYMEFVRIETALDLTSYLEQEDHFTVWQVVFTHLRKHYNLIGGTPAFTTFKNYMLPKIVKALDAVGLEQQDNHIGAAAIHRAKLLDWACSMEHPSCFEYAKKLFAQWQTTPTVNPVPVDIQAVLTCAIVASGGRTEYDFIFERYKALPVGNAVKTRLLNALACSSDTAILQDLLSKTLTTTSGLERTDATAAIQRVAMNSNGRELVLQFLKTRVTDIITIIGGGNLGAVQNIVNTLSTYISSQENLDYLMTFIKDNPVLAPISTQLQSYMTNIRANLKWKNEFGDHITAWMEKANAEKNWGVSTLSPSSFHTTFIMTVVALLYSIFN